MKSCSNCYEILEVSPLASTVEIKEAYHAAARKYHPDKSGGVGTIRGDENPSTTITTTCRFLVIQQAWECLRDPDTRRKHDQDLVRNSGFHNQWHRNAIPIQPSECRAVTLFDDLDQQWYEELIFQCRCGHDLHTSHLQPLITIDSTGSSNVDIPDSLVQCPGCSLVYDVSPLNFED